ncbi:MAG: DUF1285 domain-containing protein [Pseudomonadota bacterium]
MTDIFKMAASLSEDQSDGELPVDQWHPAHCGEMDLTIRRDGTWVYEGTPMGRPALVRLFSRVLRHDADGYVLVTPAEKLSIKVEDVPFLIVDITGNTQEGLKLRTNVGDVVTLGKDHPLDLRSGPDGVKIPYVRVRGDLWARFGRNAYYDLVDRAEETSDGHMQITSQRARFDLGSFQAADKAGEGM